MGIYLNVPDQHPNTLLITAANGFHKPSSTSPVEIGSISATKDRSSSTVRLAVGSMISSKMP